MIFLIVCSLLVSASFLLAFLWATHSGQYEDVHTPAIRMLFDDASKNSETSNGS